MYNLLCGARKLWLSFDALLKLEGTKLQHGFLGFETFNVIVT
jgi:hypothetical protein